jgi:FlgD Ig-like domain
VSAVQACPPCADYSFLINLKDLLLQTFVANGTWAVFFISCGGEINSLFNDFITYFREHSMATRTKRSLGAVGPVFSFYLSAALCLAISATAWGQKTWTGGGDGASWDQGANWSGGIAPTSSDNVLLDNSAVAGSYTVNLPTGAIFVSINRLTITPDAGNIITLILPSGNTANPGLSVGDATSGTDDIILNNGAVLKNSSGATSGNGVQANSTSSGTVRINNGGTYIHDTLRSASGMAPLLSTVAGTETGVFEYDSPGTGSVAIIASGRTYGSFTLTRTAGAAIYTASGGSALTIRGNFIINSGVTFSSTMTGAINLAGNLINSGAFLPGTGVVGMNGASAQTMSGNAVTFANLTINNTSGVTLLTDETVSNTLTLAGGNVTTGTNKMIIAPGGTVSRTSGHVVGNLQKNFATGSNVTQTFEVGTGSDYTPVDVSIASVSTAGNVTAKSTSGDHADIASSTLDASKSVNRNWTLISDGSLAFTAYEATFNFVNGDLDGGTNTNNLSVGKFDAGTWTYPTVGTRTATSMQATGMTSFSDFQLAEQQACPAANAGADLATTAGVSAKIGANPTASGGTGTLTINWSPSTGLSSTNAANPIAIPGSTTTYTLTVTDQNNCAAIDYVTVRAGNLVNSQIKAVIGPTNLYDPNLNQVRADIAIKNISGVPIYGPLTAVFKTLTPGPPTITIGNADGGDEGLGCYYDYSNLLGSDNVLSHNETSGYKLWIFQEHVTPPVSFRFFADVIGDLDNIPKTVTDQKQPLAFSFEVQTGTVEDHTVSIQAGNGSAIPEAYALQQNHPNPFNPSTTIQFDLPKAGEVTLKIYNSVGQLVRTLVSGDYEAGAHKVIWDAKDDHGTQVASGVYVSVLKAGNFVAQQKLVLMK